MFHNTAVSFILKRAQEVASLQERKRQGLLRGRKLNSCGQLSLVTSRPGHFSDPLDDLNCQKWLLTKLATISGLWGGCWIASNTFQQQSDMKACPSFVSLTCNEGCRKPHQSSSISGARSHSEVALSKYFLSMTFFWFLKAVSHFDGL